ncbi:glucosamine-6-phosphate deaminase [Arthrobacter sp. CAN_A214]|uniref:glucosamine-6-phosphate deaminase n=1 Tax=Arthrobacter sp. CAN_A214 TaxID=2787720 RepID=UPI0018CB0779
MRVIILDSAQEIGTYGANVILDGALKGTIRTLGVATGSSPLAIYRALEERWIPALAQLKAFALDEYVGLPANNPQSYRSVIQREVTDSLRLDPANVHVPDGCAADLTAESDRFETAMAAAGGVDLQLLGIGRNGHIGFNEPGSSLSSRTRPKTLMAATRRDNARFFTDLDTVPRHCLTQGLGTILDAAEVLLVAQGAAKADAVAAALEGPVSSMCPASVLQLHRRATVVLDGDAARHLALREYYVDTEKNRIEGVGE